MTKKSHDDVWFVYDGKCPICCGVARSFAIKKTVGTLQVLDARSQQDHDVMKQIHALGFNLDDGMVIKLHDNFYHGGDALHIMALIGSNVGMFNRINYVLFRYKITSKLAYPFFKFARNIVLWTNGIKKING